MAKVSEYNKYLRSLHSEKQTSEEIIRSIVKEGTGKNIVSKRKIIAGEVNEVYEVSLEDGSSIILRISPKSSNDFLKEQWAINKCKEIGVPVPNIVLIKDQVIDSKNWGFCLMERVRGDTLERGKLNFDNLNLDKRRDYIHQAGELLSKIHSITTTGWGWIIKNKGEYKNSDILFENWTSKRENYEAMAREEDIELHIINKAVKLIEEFKAKYENQTPSLNHADFANKHFMVKRGKIVAILDWGSARSDSPVYDFANWDFWFGEDIPTKWLKEGYSNKKLFDGDFQDFLHFIRITKALENLDWYHKQKYQEMVGKIKVKLIEDIGYFK